MTDPTPPAPSPSSPPPGEHPAQVLRADGDEDGTSSRAGLLPAAAATLALLALLGLLSQGASIAAPVEEVGPDRVAVLLLVFGLFALGLPLAGAVALGLRRRAAGRGRSVVSRRGALVRALAPATFVLVVASLVVVWRGGLPLPPPDEAAVRTDEPAREGTALQTIGSWATMALAGEGVGDDGEGGWTGWDSTGGRTLLLLLLGGFTAGALAFTAWRGRRSGEGADGAEPPDDGTRRAAHEAVVDTIDRMLADPDPQTAIIGAYARLLEGLQASGLGRRSYEAPVEHLRRVLASLDVRREALLELVDLFQQARFSTHRLTAEHRTRALRALRVVAADLAVPEAGGPRAEVRPAGAVR